MNNELERIIYKNKNWEITIKSSGLSGWIIGDFMGKYGVGDNWVLYNDGNVGYDFPERIPKYIKAELKKGLRRLKVICKNCNRSDELITNWNLKDSPVHCQGCNTWQ